MFYLNDDSKKKLKEKMGAAVSDEELENVAGGTNGETVEILNALAAIDPQGVQQLKGYIADAQKNNDSFRVQNLLQYGMEGLLKKNLSDVANIGVVSSEFVDNRYSINGEPVSHEEIMNLIQYKMDKDDF